MFKRITDLLLIVIIILFVFSNMIILQAQEPVPVTNPGPVSPTAAPATSTNCVPDPPDGTCSDSRPCCNYPNRQRTCDAGYCQDLTTPTPASTGATSAILISDLGDLNIGEAKLVTVPGLTSGSKYYWQESKVTSSSVLGQSYTKIFGDCYVADGSGRIEKNIGPFSVPGLFKLEIYRTSTSTSGRCEPVGSSVKSKEFFVGGPTGQGCCTFNEPRYNRQKDGCEKIRIGIQALQSAVPTECSKTNPKTYCEPDSLQCFKSEFFLVGGKVCKDPNDSDFDEDKHAICGSGAGKPCADPKDPAIQTAIGCIHTSLAGFVKDTLKFVIAISGGLAFLMMLLGAFQMLTSAGNPETLQAGRERFTSAIIGLLFIIFAVLLLRIIGVDILGLGGQFGF